VLSDSGRQSDRFALESRVGGGSSGDIYKGVDGATGQPIAVKLLRTTATPSERARFLREIKVVADLRHPNIVEYVAHGDWPDGRLYLAMEWLDGEDLAKRQRRQPLGTRDAVEVVRRAAQALAAIHARGIVHRDLKLSNIFLIKGRGTAVKLIDFGVVKPAEGDGHQTEPGTILGTPHYMAPEQARGEPVDPRADVYSLGSVLFRLLTGRNVFETDHVIALLGRLVLEDPPRPASIRFDIPEKLDHAVFRAIARHRGDRYEHAGEFARALARVGPVNNDPPTAEHSSSAILPKRVTKETTDTGTSGNRVTRPGLYVRRVVACLLYDVGEVPADQSFTTTLLDIIGEDVRVEGLAGGKTVAVFGVEHSHGDEVMRAARAALQITQDHPAARAVVAIGHAVMARSNLAGEALERAAEQLERATPGVVRLDLHAAAALELRFEIQRDESGARLVREDPRDNAPRLVLGQPTPTVGREKEIAQLHEVYAGILHDSCPRAAVVVGSPGIGKSRLRAELTARLELAPQPPEPLLCRGDSATAGSLSVLGKALRVGMGVLDGAPRDEQIQRVKQFVKSRLPRSLHFLAAFMGELVGVPFSDEHDEPLRAARANDQLMQSRIRMALEAFVRTQAARIPQLVILEDAHLVDDTTIELLEWLLTCPDLRLCVFAFARPEIDVRRPAMWSTPRLGRLLLGPLSPVAAERIVAAVLPKTDAKRRADIVRRAGGNPLVLEELVRCSAEGRDELPLTVQALVQLRLDGLPPEVRESLRAASVFGQLFWSGGVAALVHRGPEEELAAAEHAEVVLRQPSSRVAGQTEWMFRQALVRDAAYASLIEEDRRTMHLAAGDWLEAVGCADLGLVAGHFDVGGAKEKAASLYARATQQALANFGQMDTALELAHRGLACGATGGERAQLLLTLAHVSHRTGRLGEAIEAAEQASRLVPAASEMWVEAQRILSACLIESGRATEGDARLVWALGPQFEPHLGPGQRAVLYATRVRGLVDLNRPGKALSVADQALRAAQDAGPRAELPRLRAADARLFALMTLGAPAEAVEAAELVIEAAERGGDVHLASRARINTASSLNLLGRFEDAQLLIERALPDVRSFRLRILEASAIHNLGMSFARRGEIDRGVEMQRNAAAIADECGSTRVAINARMYETVMLVWRGAPGDLRHAHALATHVVQASEAQLGLQVIALFALARVQLARRDLGSALEVAAEAHRRLGDGPVEEWDEAIRLCYVEALLAGGMREQADEVLRASFEVVRQRVTAIRRSDLRESYTTRIDEVYRLLGLAHERLGLMLG
jgi:tetratricopeptide (TPR) repeat protein